ncbi:dihydrofolate reductase [Chlamydia sp.]|uniref:dihydrofolate reductase n=1 Tax=Chlamydia sp. TaxID=35827 RepID=UPI0025C0DEDB|nr:dihydrofolate reductase [Chlamydia sp.]MBQ8498893.1 dihydrofolate reductase [Chlamydia sp.]
MMEVTGVVAVDPKGVMGASGKLPWSYPEDLRFFAETIQNNPIIMGRKTWETLPSKYKSNRKVVVFSRKYRASQGIWVSSFEEYKKLFLQNPFLIGGAELFEVFFQQTLLKTCFVTHIKKEYLGDTIFPLKYLSNWNRECIRSTVDFTIYCYENYSYKNTQSISE